MTQTQTVAITGNTYPVKDALRAMGARWNPDQKAWMVPAAKADAARKLVAAAPASGSTARSKTYRPNKCVVCGFVPTRNRRGYLDEPIYRSGECRSCYEERKMGY
jgi:hypothetical protein